MIEADLGSLYQYYANMKFHGHYSISEIDSLLPFERDIMFGLLKKNLDEKNK